MQKTLVNMATIYCSFIFAFFGYICESNGTQHKLVDEFHVLDRIAKLELMQTRCDLHGRDLETKVKLLEAKNAILQREALKKEELMNNRIGGQDNKIDAIVSQLQSFHETNPRLHQRQIDTSSRVAFSAFLDHDVDNLGPDQVINFNQVQLNEGGGYSNQTGAFTVPTSGIYVFTFFIGERDSNQLYVKLVVNGVSKSDAVAETISSSHDSQGGNVVILSVAKGDVVMIEHNTWGSHIEGYPDIRLSTFSGFLLYPLDPEVVIGK